MVKLCLKGAFNFDRTTFSCFNKDRTVAVYKCWCIIIGNPERFHRMQPCMEWPFNWHCRMLSCLDIPNPSIFRKSLLLVCIRTLHHPRAMTGCLSLLSDEISSQSRRIVHRSAHLTHAWFVFVLHLFHRLRSIMTFWHSGLQCRTLLHWSFLLFSSSWYVFVVSHSMGYL